MFGSAIKPTTLSGKQALNESMAVSAVFSPAIVIQSVFSSHNLICARPFSLYVCEYLVIRNCRHLRPATHIDHQVRLDEAIVDLDQITHLVHTQVDQVILIVGIVRSNTAARPTCWPEAIDHLGRQDVERRWIRKVD